MRPYVAVLGARYRGLLQYRVAAMAGCCTQIFWGVIRVMIFKAFYASTMKSQPMSLAQVTTYVWLGQAMFAVLPLNLDADVVGMVRTGSVAYEMLRPTDLYSFWYARALASRLAPTTLRAIPVFLIAGLLFGLHAPPSAACLFAWIGGTVGAFALSAAFSMLLTAGTMLTLSADGIARLAPALVFPLAGMLIPVSLFPLWTRSLINTLPFRDMMDTPFRLYMGHIPPSAIGFVLLREAGWLFAMVVAGRALMAVGCRRLTLQGG